MNRASRYWLLSKHQTATLNKVEEYATLLSKSNYSDAKEIGNYLLGILKAGELNEQEKEA